MASHSRMWPRNLLPRDVYKRQVVDCVKAQKDYPNAAPGAKRLAQRLQEFQEDSRVKLEQFL